MQVDVHFLRTNKTLSPSFLVQFPASPSFDLLPDTFARPYLLLFSTFTVFSLRSHPRCSAICRWLRWSHVSYLYSHLHITNGVCLRGDGGRLVVFPDASTAGMRWIRLPVTAAYLPPARTPGLVFFLALWQRFLRPRSETHADVYARGTTGCANPVKRNERKLRKKTLSDVRTLTISSWS